MSRNLIDKDELVKWLEIRYTFLRKVWLDNIESSVADLHEESMEATEEILEYVMSIPPVNPQEELKS